MFLIIFFLLDLSITEREVLISTTMTVNLSISPFSSINFCLMNFDTTLLSVYTFKIVISSWRIELLSLYDGLLTPDSFVVVVLKSASFELI